MIKGLRSVFRAAWFAWASIVRVVLRPVVMLAHTARLTWAILRAKTAGTTLFWGPTPLVNNKYWSRAMTEAGYDSVTLMELHYPNYKRTDFDLYFEDLIPADFFPRSAKPTFAPYIAMLYMLRRGKVVHLSFAGGPLGKTRFWRLEPWLFRRAGIRIVVFPYGSDGYMYSRVVDPSVRHALLMSYPHFGRHERAVAERVQFWTERADAVIPGWMLVDGYGRWDILVPSLLCIDTAEWSVGSGPSPHDGRSGPVRIIHTPNHRGFKGTEFILAAVGDLQREGLQVELELLERIPNDQVRERMRAADILVEQCIVTGYALSAVEGMATGLPVIANLHSESGTRIFRRYSFLDECPVVSATPETLTAVLRTLVTDPDLRRKLGAASRSYVEKYHSYDTARYLFGSLYAAMEGKEVDLLRLFHPSHSEYARRLPRVNHPLRDSRLPPELALQVSL